MKRGLPEVRCVNHEVSRLNKLLSLAVMICGSMTTSGVLLPAVAQTSDVETRDFFESKVRPLLAEHCFRCHSMKAETLRGELYLDNRDRLLKGGQSGAVVLPGDPENSLLVQAIRWEELKMPPSGRLTENQVAVLVRWVKLGAPWPEESQQSSQVEADIVDWERLRADHWAFQPVKAAKPPVVKSDAWPQNEIDYWILSKLESRGLRPVRKAAARILIRRMYFDLIGLPPSPGDVLEFEKEMTRQPLRAIESLIDRLLHSNHYGERWGRFWLDVARYSDGYGGFLDNAANNEAWRYRDWVVQAMNADFPIHQFLRLQIAGDQLVGKEGAVATGFFALGPSYHSDGGDPDSVAQAQAETLSDRIDILGRGILGLTLACARCHDHKFDPIPQKDYYSLAGIFNNTDVREFPLVPAEIVKDFQDHHQAIKDLEGKIKNLRELIKKDKREFTEEEQIREQNWKESLEHLKKTVPDKYAFAHALADTGSADMKLAIRGNLRKPGESVPRRFLWALSGDKAVPFTKGSGRLELADAVVKSNNPLTPRVFVNRVWMHHFGTALVRTPDNFGVLGQLPTHPELLDWLVSYFTNTGWSLKSLHRVIMTSAAYQMSSAFDQDSFDMDGDNQLLWRMNARRLDVEAWRDALLSVTGELNYQMGGVPTEDIKSFRRTLYFKVSRNGDRFETDHFLRLFDFPLMRETVAKRTSSIVAQQFLFMMNDAFMVDRAKALVTRLKNEVAEDGERIDLAYRLLYSREPTEMERQLGMQFLTSEGSSENEELEVDRDLPIEESEKTPRERLSKWAQYAQVLLSANEFMYVR